MTTENPFAPSQVTVAQMANTHGRQDLHYLSTDQLKRLMNDGSSTFALACFWLVMSLLMFFAAVVVPFAGLSSERDPDAAAMIPFLLLVFGSFGTVGLVAAIGVFLRANWGRIVGMILCGLMLIHFPLGTILGIAGLIAFARGADLFGPERLDHRRIKAEYKYRRRNRIA